MFRIFTRERSKLHARIQVLEERLQLATYALQKISDGSFSFDIPSWKEYELDKEGKEFYETLHSVKTKLAEFTRKDHEQKWIAEGLNEFMNLVGGNDRTKAGFYDDVLSFLVRYTDANQGGIFLYNDTSNNEHPFLELVASYAFGKKRFLEKQIPVGHGLLGQCFLESQTRHLTDVPEHYIKISSGLGEATPRNLIMLPLRSDGDTVGIIELAYFKRVGQSEIEFLERIAANLASVTLNIKHAKRAEILFKESQLKAQALQHQEDVLEQKVQELTVTQEEMKRQQHELQAQSDLMKMIIDSIPFPIFVKDDGGRYSLVNKAESKLFDIDEKGLIGKDDSHFVKDNAEWQVIRRSDQEVLSSDKPVELPLQHFTTGNGKTYIFKTTKIPFLNGITGARNILGVSIDLTEKLSLETKLAKEKEINENNTYLNLAGRQRMLSQKIGFYCEAIFRGKIEHASLLREAIELHEHSLQVLRYGGIPIGIISDNPLPMLPKELHPKIDVVEAIWKKYKSAAENILYFHLTGNSNTNSMDHDISVIEENGEVLLNASNQFMLAYIEYRHEKMAVT